MKIITKVVLAGLFSMLVSAYPTKADLLDGLLAYWSCDEGSGTVAYDLTTADNDAVFSLSGIGWAAGHNGTGLSFDGSGGFAQVTSFANLPLGNSPRTIAAWIMPTISSASEFMLGYGPHADKQHFGLYRKGNVDTGFSVEGHNYNLATGVALPAGTWTHVAATLDADGTLTAYVNGSPVGGGYYGLFNTTSTEFLLGNGPAKSIPFSGIIDEAAVYNRALSGTEINALKDTALVPEPSAALLLGMGALALLHRRKTPRP